MRCNIFARASIILAVLSFPACNSDGQLPLDCYVLPEVVSVLPEDIGERVYRFDGKALTFTGEEEGHEWLVRYSYDSIDAFKRERETLGLQAWSSMKLSTEGPIVNSRASYDEDGRLLAVDIDSDDTGLSFDRTLSVDTWDDAGRPLRVFVNIYEDDAPDAPDDLTLACELIVHEYEYMAPEGIVIRRDTPGIDPRNGENCGGSAAHRYFYNYYPYTTEKVEYWESDPGNLDEHAPDKVFEENTVSSTQEICLLGS